MDEDAEAGGRAGRGDLDTAAVVVGAGPAGLAASACLKQAGVPHLLLERENGVGPAWARHYERLHLHTSRRHSSLPLRPLPPDYPTFPSREQVHAYLEGYARALGLAPHLGEEVREARSVVVGERPRGTALHGWEVTTSRARYRNRFLVVATGYNGQAVLPELPGLDRFGGPVLHTSQYRDGRPFAGQRVLVVGCGKLRGRDRPRPPRARRSTVHGRPRPGGTSPAARSSAAPPRRRGSCWPGCPPGWPMPSPPPWSG